MLRLVSRELKVSIKERCLSFKTINAISNCHFGNNALIPAGMQESSTMEGNGSVA